MSAEVLFEKDMLYPTDNSIEPGCIHIRIMGPDSRSRLPDMYAPRFDAVVSRIQHVFFKKDFCTHI